MSDEKSGAKESAAEVRRKKGTGTAEKKPGSEQRRAKRAMHKGPIFTWPFGRRNGVFMIIAIAVIIIGYVFLAMGSYDSFTSLDIAPILLVIGYLVLIPIAIIMRDPTWDKDKDR